SYRQPRSCAAGFHQRLNGPPTRPLRPVIPDNAPTLRITAAAGTELAGASFGGTVTLGLLFEAEYSSPPTVVYNPKAVIPHAASLRQPCGHCAIFPTAASRRSLGRVSVPMWLAILSDQLPVVALVGHYPANKLIGREPLRRRNLAAAFLAQGCPRANVSGITRPLGRLSPADGQVAHVLRTHLPLRSEEHTSELQSRGHLVCRLLLEKK